MDAPATPVTSTALRLASAAATPTIKLAADDDAVVGAEHGGAQPADAAGEVCFSGSHHGRLVLGLHWLDQSCATVCGWAVFQV
jgi:hypothetical protein